MTSYQRNLAFLSLLLLFAAGGAGCPRMMGLGHYPTMPRLLPPQPTLEQVIAVVNRNSSQIQSFSTDRATIAVSGSPTLRANIAMQRPRRFRLTADTALTVGPEFDLGSNDQEFWFWFRGDPQQNVFYCRHDQFAQSTAARAIPIAPDELIDALGLAQFDPALPHQGPFVRAGGMLEIRTIRETPAGPVTKVTVVDPAGWIAEQHFYDARGQLALSTVAQQHRRDPASGLIMPRVVEVTCPTSNFRMRVNLGNVRINTISSAPTEAWTMPHYEGARLVDLGDPNVRLDVPPAAPYPVSQQ
ncbi:MAG TPA: hypothetical protein VJL29_07665 [Thermoguttaceae bacterium]|nr:hypothetical protein [Thermoguttaceae bacterium]